MNARHLLAAPLVAAAVAGPYLAKESAKSPALESELISGAPLVASLGEPAAIAMAEAADAAAPLNVENPAAAAEQPVGAEIDPSALPLPPLDAGRAKFAGAPVSNFADVLRFDVTPEWIFTRWSRVSTVTADQKLKGFRVPLVTGTRVDDLAGVATYYFGRYGYLQRVAFEGNTGDTRRLVAFLSQNYGFKAEPNLGAGMYLVRWNAKPMSALRVDYAPVVRADAPHLRYTVKLEINRPDESYQMSDDFREILSQDQDTQRWLPF
jgi:hypothetical protein